ncbi:uncharacterized protein DSM5745_00340 [Aspergillus mulundensis]|uniref:Uncharacterized protein n=1 Tax=Aspergillus mulundensis TaxID=1810919 RepID=A0A3D8T4U5_9EURO|nr:Uncharacterized protein DSM5745_00340 [Aspergillus mulundensis]RDW93018.1 Uncharacterized protein DSM5745_00340 [Aspergillus mulundensis]
MSSPISHTQPQPPTSNAPPSSWHQLNNRWTRNCAGGEPGVNYNQNVRDGHTELTLSVPFSTTIPVSALIQRARNTWLRCHASHPEIAVQLATGTDLPQTMSFEPLRSNADAAAWLDESFRVVSHQSAQQVASMTYNRRLPTKGKRNMLYLVLAGAADPEFPDRHCLVWNFSHVLADIYSTVQFFNNFFKSVTEVPGDRGLDVRELDYTGLASRLPVTPVTPYEATYRPSRAEKEEALRGALAQTQLYADKMSHSIAMYPEPDAAARTHGTHCIRLQYTESESRALLSSLSAQKISITFAAAAATILAVKQTYGRGHETGALLGMTRNARRWVQTEATHRVPNAADVVYLWVPFKAEWFEPEMPTHTTILHLAREVRKALGPHLTSPHYISTFAFTADRVIEALKREGEPVPAPQAPGFSPQGALPLGKHFTSTSGSGDASITTHDFVHSGRQINPSAWTGMFSLWGRVTLSMGFDGKYYDPGRMEGFMGRVKGNLGSLVLGEGWVDERARL